MPEKAPLFRGSLGAPINESREPVKNLLAAFERVCYANKKITRQGLLPSKQERPDAVRVERAKLYQHVMQLRQEKRKILEQIQDTSSSADEKEDKTSDTHWDTKRKLAPLLLEAKQRDILAKQYLTQRELSVPLPELGLQSSRVIELVLPEKDRDMESQNLPPIFLIPGISNDVECVGSLAMEVAMKGRRVIVVGYPESYNGSVTPEFVKAVADHASYGPHVAFYKAALDSLIPNKGEVELWGYSTGCPITAELLTDPDYQSRTKNAVLICPASSVDQSQTSLTLGAIAEAKHFATTKETTASLMMTAGSLRPETKTHEWLRTKTFEALSTRVRRAYPFWKSARVQGEKPIIVVNCEQDQITKSDQLKDQLREDEHIDLITLPGAYHTTPLLEPANTIQKIFEHQKHLG